MLKDTSLLILILIITMGGVLMNYERMLKEKPVLVVAACEEWIEDAGITYDSDDLILLQAIREAENGPDGYEFGVKAAKGTDLKTQAKWTLRSIINNKKRYCQFIEGGEYQGSLRTVYYQEGLDFIEFMGYYGSPTGYGWVPIHMETLPKSEIELNKNWSRNVKKFYAKLK